MKIYEKSQKIIFTDNALECILWCFSVFPLVWGYFRRVYALTKPRKAFLMIFGTFWSKYGPNKQKIARKSTFSEQKIVFLDFVQKIQFVVRQNHFLSSETWRTHVYWPRTIRVCENNHLPCLEHNFLRLKIFTFFMWNFLQKMVAKIPNFQSQN